MADIVKILVINPGSTSTKIAICENEISIISHNIMHPSEELAKFKTIASQYDLRESAILKYLTDNNHDIKDFTAIMARGGALPPVKSGAYRINQEMVNFLKYRPAVEHMSNLAPIIAFELEKSFGTPSYIYDPVCVDELDDIARISGMPVLPRDSYFHALNQRAVARKAAEAYHKPYSEMNIIVAHIGGGVTMGIHKKGRIVDIMSDDEGAFSPERAGRVSCRNLIKLCYSGKYDFVSMSRMLRGEGGLYAYLGTSDAREIEHRIENGDDQAKLVYEAMAYQLAKGIGELATVVSGNVDVIILTGGVAHSKMITRWVQDRVQFIAPVMVIPGENEMEALALGALRVLRGEEEAHVFHTVN